MALLEIEDLCVSFSLYEGRADVLDKVSIRVGEGERVAIVGESGCGKSLTLRAILGLLDPRAATVSGKIEFDGLDVRGSAVREMRGREISMIFQDPMAALNPTFTVGDQLAAIARRGGRLSRRETLPALRAALQAVQIVDPDRVLASYPFQLSGGLCQRVLITMALLNKPKLVLADEPGTALDVTVQRQTLELMTGLVEETRTALLLITHNLGVVREYSDRIYVMYAGTVVESGPTAEIFEDCRHPYTRALIRSVPRLMGGELPAGIPGSLPDYTKAMAGCRFFPRCPEACEACSGEVGMVSASPAHAVRCAMAEGRA